MTGFRFAATTGATCRPVLVEAGLLAFETAFLVEAGAGLLMETKKVSYPCPDLQTFQEIIQM